VLAHAAAGVVLLAALYMLGLATLIVSRPTRAIALLDRFARTLPAHLLELAIRATVAIALLLHAPRMLLPGLFTAFGWLLLATTAVLLVLPWRWHRAFARWSVPLATRRPALLGTAALIGSMLMLACFLFGWQAQALRPA